jgi:hypothetical protein
VQVLAPILALFFCPRMQPGEIFVLPRDAYEGGDPKSRAHVAVSLPGSSQDITTLAFCSTEDTEARFGAPHVVLNPRAPTFGITGLSALTYVYPSRLVNEEYLRLGTPIGRVVDEMPLLRDVLRVALGVGQGTATHGHARGTLRMQVVLLGAALAEEVETRHALVVADPMYARRQRFVNIVPLYDAEDFEPADSDIILDRSEWGRRVTRSGNVLCSITAICSLFLPDRQLFESLLGLVVSEADANAVDSALERRFFDDGY